MRYRRATQVWEKRADNKGLQAILSDVMNALEPGSTLKRRFRKVINDIAERAKNTSHLPRIIVRIEGGNFQGASANTFVDLSILDIDNKKACQSSGDKEGLAYYRYLERELRTLFPIK